VCGNAAIHADLRISIQVRGARDRVEGQVAVGILADSHMVLVPNPPVRLLEDSPELEVMVIPVPPRTHALIERFSVIKKVIYNLRRSPHHLEAAVLTLGGFSRYAAQLAECDPVELGRELERNGGDWWAALERLDLVPASVNDVPAELLCEAGRVEQNQYRPRRDSQTLDSYTDVAREAGCIGCKCNPGRGGHSS
jgi:hypothetical protein